MTRPGRATSAASAPPMGLSGGGVKSQQALNEEQERLRIEGLRALARIIARGALAPSAGRMPAMRTDGTCRGPVRNESA